MCLLKKTYGGSDTICVPTWSPRVTVLCNADKAAFISSYRVLNILSDEV